MKKKTSVVPYYSNDYFDFCFFEDIERVHGIKFMKKFNDEMYGSTCPVIEEKDRPEGYKGNLFACYPWDYERFRDKVIKGKPTFFD